MKKQSTISLAVVLVIVIAVLWLVWGPNSWDVQITGVTGNGRDVPYRIETVYTNTTDTLIFRNEDAGFTSPYFNFASADLQAFAILITQGCPLEPVTVHGYGLRIAFLDMLPNATSIDAPQRCIDAPSNAGAVGG